ncbi:monocarboxylate transporter 10-like [Haliotis rubra]|uniref:monocarboxylate transporter 10-like n=1 Tax=Haliotis rubra TaxID=36100 RepID=UPI001EE513CF|nr:monocarboxylate transporter 10-like [Haliotis rubra]XP_046550193.1 monocarboxylate transporter 10-like [Haliotis rubra]XP_046550195.1 monocarboxylate transporter 10-like [Haliotis rubra]XP_046550196.1 monocarboxylate transporter 10-like [Haliotis rubra]
MADKKKKMGKYKTTEADEPLQGATEERSARGGDFEQPDGGWGWVVCFTSMWANGTVFGIINTFGIVYVHMRDLYAKDDPDVSFKTSWVGSVCTGTTFLMCMFASIVSDRLGIRKTAMFGGFLGFLGLLASAFVNQLQLLYLTYGILLGIGSSCSYAPSLVILGHYFRKHMGLVNGLVTFGSSVFTIGLSLCLPVLLKEAGLRYTFIFLGGLNFLLIFCALTWKPLIKRESNLASLALSKESIVEHVNDCCSFTKKFLNVNIWKNKGYVVWALSNGVSLFGYFVPFVHLVKHTSDRFPSYDGSLLVMCMSITSGVGRIVFGKVADFSWVNRIRMQQFAFLILGVTTMCIPFANNFASLIAITLVMGICDGIFICLLGPIAFDIVGPTGASQALGFLFGIFSLPMTVGPPIAGLLYDHLGSYNIAFHCAGAPPIIGAIIMFLIPRTKQTYPGVTDTQEFAALSQQNIFAGPDHDDELKVNGKGPSATEMIVVEGHDLLEEFAASSDKQALYKEEVKAELSSSDDKPDNEIRV